MLRLGLIALLGVLIAAALALSIWRQFLLNPRIDQVVVRLSHADAPINRTISSSHELEAFRAIWSKREKLSPDTHMQVQYKFEILSDGHADSWLYDPAGLTRVLSKARTPVYRLPSPEAFNKLIGADSGAATR